MASSPDPMDPDAPPVESPLTVARDKLQASAREIIRNFEHAMGSPNQTPNPSVPVAKLGSHSPNQDTTTTNEGSLEQAFRVFFSSCTSGAASATTNEMTADITPVSTQPSQDTSSLSSKSTPQPPRRSAAKESLRRLAARHVQANKEAHPFKHRHNSLGQYESPSNRSTPQRFVAPRTASARQAAPGEHIYEHLFYDEEQVDAEAQFTVDRRASQTPPDHDSTPAYTEPALLGATPLPYSQPPKQRSITKPFPVTSSPASEKAAHPSVGILIQQNNTFDDGISAISSHTLEAMARREPPSRVHVPHDGEILRSGSSSQRHSSTSSSRRNRVSPRTPQRRMEGLGVSPLSAVTRSYSSGTTPSQHGYGTPLSRVRSVSTTQSHNDRSFEQWQNSEQQYWEQEVQKPTRSRSQSTSTRNKQQRQPSKPRRSLGGGDGHYYGRSHSRLRRNADATMSTSSSTALSRTSSWQHPHETFDFGDPNDVFYARGVEDEGEI